MGRRPNKHFFKEDIQMTHRHMKRCSTINNYQRKANQSHLTPARMSIIKTFTNNKRCRGCGEKGTLLHCWWECKLVQSLWKTVQSFLRKLKTELPHDPAIPLVGIYSDKTIIQKDTCNRYVHNSTILNSQDMETT